MPLNIYFKNNSLYKNDQLFPMGIAEWNSAQTYTLNEFVTYSGAIYFSKIINNFGNNPITAPFSWQEFESGGAGYNIKSYDVSVVSGVPKTINHYENNDKMFVFSRTVDDELILPDVKIINGSQLTVEFGENYQTVRTNLIPINNNIYLNETATAGSTLYTHNLDLDNYFVIAKDNSKISGQLILPDVMSQTKNDCVLSFSEDFGDIDYYFINKDTFDTVRSINTVVGVGASTIKVNHNVGNSDYFIWAINNDTTEAILPDCYNLGERYATLDFNSSISDVTIFFGGTTRDSAWFTGSSLQTAKVVSDNNGYEWKLSVDGSGILTTTRIG